MWNDYSIQTINLFRGEGMIAPSSGSIEQLLIAAETDVALFALERCDIGGIATWRGSVAGIGRAQLAWVYAKSGVESPHQA